MMRLCFGQNLVMNPSFEDYISCPTDQGQVYKLIGWSDPSGNGNAGSDFWHQCNSIINGAADSSNARGVQMPYMCSGFAGTLIWQEYKPYPPFDVREYLQGNLIEELVQGQKYLVSMYVNLADNSNYATGSISIYFSDTLIVQPALTVLLHTPQLNFNTLITDKINWSYISAEYIASGGEKYFTIGNFLSDINTTNVQAVGAPPPYGGSRGLSYYYIDNVSIARNTSTISDTFMCVGDTLTISAQSEQNYSWSTGDTTQEIYVTGTDTYYVEMYQTCDLNIYWDTFVVKANDCNEVYIPNAFSPNNDGINDMFYLSGYFPTNSVMQIYDQFGKLVFATNDLNLGWDGKQKGKDCNRGVYIYRITINEKPYLGNVSLLK